MTNRATYQKLWRRASVVSLAAVFLAVTREMVLDAPLEHSLPEGALQKWRELAGLTGWTGICEG